MTVKLYIGNKKYSSWSMRPWLCLKKAGVAFEEEVIPLDTPGFKEAILKVSPAGTVPVLELNGVVITESLAIAEWAAEQSPSIWPSDETARARARAAASLMHAGFAALRRECPMNMHEVSARQIPQDGLGDAAKVDAFWGEWLKASGGPFLFGDWSVADAFYAPVVTRFETYRLPRSDASQAYIDAMLADDAFQEWAEGAKAETWRIERTDDYLK